MDRISEYAPSSRTGVSSDVERLRRDMSLSSTAAQYGYKLTRNGQEFATCCPFHAEDTPSFTIFIGQDGVERFHCFGCAPLRKMSRFRKRKRPLCVQMGALCSRWRGRTPKWRVLEGPAPSDSNN
jgi:hypothetical protein